MKPFLPPHTQSPGHGGNMMQAAQALAFWLAALCTLVLTPQIWGLSLWIGERILEPQFGYELASWLVYAVFAILVMASIHAARMGLGTSLAIAALTLLTKLPVF